MAEASATPDRWQVISALLRKARIDAGKSVEQSAVLLGCPMKTIIAYESARKAIALPELEVLAEFYGVPISYFWQAEMPKEPDLSEQSNSIPQRLLLRRKLIGAQLRKARQDCGKSLQEAAESINATPRRIEQYECGERDVPVLELEALAALYGLTIGDFVYTWASVGRKLASEVSVPGPRVALPAETGLEHLDPEMRKFVTKPVNLLYLQIAQKLSRLSAAELRSLAESLLEITY